MSDFVIEAFATEKEATIKLTAWKQQQYLPVGPGIFTCQSANWNNTASTEKCHDTAWREDGQTYLVIVKTA